MRSNDLKVGEHYAYSNQRSGNRYMQRVKIVTIGVEIRVGNYEKAQNGVLVDYLENGGSPRKAPRYFNEVVRPGTLHWLWAKEIEYKAARAAKSVEYQEDQKIVEVELRELVENANEILGSNVFKLHRNGSSYPWVVSNSLRAVPLAKLIVEKIRAV